MQMRTQVNTTQIKNKSKQSIKKNQVKTLCKEESQLKNDNQQQQRQLKMKRLSSATNQLVAKALWDILLCIWIHLPAYQLHLFVKGVCSWSHANLPLFVFRNLLCFMLGKAYSHWPPLIFEPTPPGYHPQNYKRPWGAHITLCKSTSWGGRCFHQSKGPPPLKYKSFHTLCWKLGRAHVDLP